MLTHRVKMQLPETRKPTGINGQLSNITNDNIKHLDNICGDIVRGKNWQQAVFELSKLTNQKLYTAGKMLTWYVWQNICTISEYRKEVDNIVNKVMADAMI